MTRFPLCPHRLIVVALTSLLVGCSTDPAFFDAEAQRHLANQAPIFTCDKCEGVTLRSQIPSAPTVAPTNGWDAAKSIAGSVSNIVTGQAGTILAGYAINALSTSGQQTSNPTPVIVNPSTVTTTTTGDTISTYQANQNTESTITTSSTSNALDNSGQIAGGDASVANSYNPHTETATTTSSHNPSYTTITDTEQTGAAP